MVYIESAEAKKELGRIDDILNEKHLLIGGLAVKYFYPARESKDIDLVCSDAVRNTIIRELYPTNEWDIFDENMDEYRPDYHIKNKKNGLIISFGPKIKEREPYADIDWDLLVKEYSIAFENKRVKYKKIYIPSAGALAFTKLISFVNRETHKDIQDLQDFVDLTNHKSCALDDLFNLIDRVADKSKLRENFWKKIASKKECASIIAKGNIFKLADFFTESKPSPQSNGFADATNKVNILEDNPIIFFSQKKRLLEADISDNLKNAEEFFFMARTGVNFLGSHKSAVCHAIDNGCVCKFLIVNQHSPAIDYGQLRPIVDRKNVPVSYQWLQEIKEYDKGRNRVEIRVLNNFPPFGIEYFKKKDGKKIINVRPYFLTNYEPEKRPLLMVKEHSEWQNIFYSEFEQLWEKAQIWGNTRGWGKPKRIVLDGSPGGGKTTLLSGTSQRDIYNREFKGINKSGYTVFGNLINASIEDMRRKSANKSIQPPDDWKLFFECATDRAIKYYEAAKPDLITFYDRGIFYLEIMAERNNCKEMLPEKYFSFINENRYDDPIFIVHPILGIEIKPLEGDSKTRVFTDDERIEQDKKIVALYKRHRYRVIEIPSPDSPDLIRNFEVVNNSVNDRLSIIKKELGL